MISSKRASDNIDNPIDGGNTSIRQGGSRPIYIYTYRRKREEKVTQGWETKENSPWTRV
jgi:hypothetical protein